MDVRQETDGFPKPAGTCARVFDQALQRTTASDAPKMARHVRRCDSVGGRRKGLSVRVYSAYLPSHCASHQARISSVASSPSQEADREGVESGQEAMRGYGSMQNASWTIPKSRPGRALDERWWIIDGHAKKLEPLECLRISVLLRM